MQRWALRLRALLVGQEPATGRHVRPSPPPVKGAEEKHSARPAGHDAAPTVEKQDQIGPDDTYLHWVRDSGAWQLRGSLLPPTRAH